MDAILLVNQSLLTSCCQPKFMDHIEVLSSLQSFSLADCFRYERFNGDLCRVSFGRSNRNFWAAMQLQHKGCFTSKR
ncbi:Uncharacterised protein [Mycobacteroides abscessus subsp. abscessus]|nr:Uncharacterised protein [Mycobacteroides abscessus subsp. abscessus]